MTHLADQLDHATADLDPGEDLLDRVRAGGRSRLRRRNVARGIGTAGLVAAVLAGGTAVLPRSGSQDSLGPATSSAASAALDRVQPDRTAADTAFGDAALAVWNAHPPEADPADRGFFDDVRGPAQLYWSGTTAAGRAAVVTQRSYLHEHDNLNPMDAGPYELRGFFGVDDAGRASLVGTDYVRLGPVPAGQVYDVHVGGWWVDPARTVLAVLDEDQPLAVSSAWTYTADGRASRTDWRPIDDLDGLVGTVRVRPSGDLQLAAQPATDFSAVRFIVGGPPEQPGTGAPVGTPDRRLVQGRPSATWLNTVHTVGSQRPSGRTAEQLGNAFSQALEPLTFPLATSSAVSLWYIQGPGFVIGERALDVDPSRLYAVLGNRVVDGGAIDPTAPLPIALRLPDARGWVVGSPGATLRWRQGSGAWTPIADHALLPDGTDLSVEVTRPGAAPVVVPLRA